MTSDAYAVVATDLFEEDLDWAVDYYRREVGPRSAARFLNEYERVVGLLECFPGFGSPIGETGLRWASMGVFDAIYHIDEGVRRVTLMRLFYCKADWKTYLMGAGL